METLASFVQKSTAFIQAFNTFGDEHGLALLTKVDHIGFKCESTEQFEQLRALLEPEAHFVYQSYISGRRIAIIKLRQPFETVLGPIHFFELSDQKPDNSQTARFDHAEIYPVGITHEQLAHALEGKGIVMEKTERPHHTTYDISLGEDIKLKLTREPLIEKIKRDEML